MNGPHQLLDISWSTIAKLVLAGFGVYVIFLVREILVWVLFGLIISVLFDPMIDALTKRHIPRVVATVGLYFGVFGLFAYVIFSVTPIFLHEMEDFATRLPEYFEEKISPALRGLGVSAFQDFQSVLNAFAKDAAKSTANIFKALFVIFGGIFSTVFVISVALFLSLEDRPVERIISMLFPSRYEALALQVWAKSQRKVSGWFLSRVISSLFVFFATYAMFLVFGIETSRFSLSALAALLNFIPIVGPIIAGVLIALLIALESPWQALLVLVAFTLIQQIDGNVLEPLLARRFVGLPPSLVLISLAVGSQFWGIMGAILAIPLAGVLFEFLRDFLKKRKEESTDIL